MKDFLQATSTCRQLYDLRDYAFYLIKYKIPFKKDSHQYHKALEYLHSLVSSQNDASLTTGLAKLRFDVQSKHKEIKGTICSTAFKYFLSFKGSTEYIPLSQERAAINTEFITFLNGLKEKNISLSGAPSYLYYLANPIPVYPVPRMATMGPPPMRPWPPEIPLIEPLSPLSPRIIRTFQFPGLNVKNRNEEILKLATIRQEALALAMRNISTFEFKVEELVPSEMMIVPILQNDQQPSSDQKVEPSEEGWRLCAIQ